MAGLLIAVPLVLAGCTPDSFDVTTDAHTEDITASELSAESPPNTRYPGGFPVDAHDRLERYRDSDFWIELDSVKDLEARTGATSPLPTTVLGGDVMGVMYSPDYDPADPDSHPQGFVAYTNGVSLNITVLPDDRLARMFVDVSNESEEPGFADHTDRFDIGSTRIVAGEAFDQAAIAEADGTKRRVGSAVKWNEGRLFFGLLKESGSTADLVEFVRSRIEAAPAGR